MAWRKKGRRGRPRQANGRRRATTLAGRAPPPDYGSPELLYRKLAVANGATVPVELTDLAGILGAHSLITAEELTTLRQLANWLRQVRVAFGLQLASPSGLWAAILSGQSGGSRGWLSSISASDRRTGGDRAALKLAELYSHFGELRQLDRLGQVMRVAAGETAPTNARALAELRAGLLDHLGIATSRPRPPSAISGRDVVVDDRRPPVIEA